MKPLLILLATFLIALFAIKFLNRRYEFSFAGRIALSVMLLFTAIAHFTFTKGMTMMMPEGVPFKIGLVYITGIIEILAAAGIQLQPTRMLTGWLLIAFFLLLLPANINAALKHIDYQMGTTTGAGPSYLWFRVPLQIFFIAWTYLSCIR